MRYLSTFTGIGVFEKAIHKVFPKATCVGYSEIDKFAEVSYLKNFPRHTGKNLGDIRLLTRDENGVINREKIEQLPDFDLLVGGSPCQDLSIAKSNRQGLQGEKSNLFYDFLAIYLVKQPKYFILENVASMSKTNRQLMSIYFECDAHKISSDRFTAQKRFRLYWYNWPDVKLPEKGWRWDNLVAWSRSTRYPQGKESYVEERETRDGRANTLTTGKGCGSFSSMNFIEGSDETGRTWRRQLTPEEAEKLQGLPEGWTVGSDSQRYKQIGNAVTYDVIERILQGI